MTVPTVHLNGTGREGLRRKYRTAYLTLTPAIEALRQTTPHGRDYYPQDGGTTNGPRISSGSRRARRASPPSRGGTKRAAQSLSGGDGRLHRRAAALDRRSARVMPTYHVNVIGEYEFAKHDDNIASCRRWAAGAFPGKRASVCRPYCFCETCQSAPCGSPRRRSTRTTPTKGERLKAG
jgi:hypothetical protein